MKNTLQEFRKFILRGNVMDLAIAVVVGAAFTGVVNAVVKDLITPLITIFYSKSQFADAYFAINGSRFLYGDFINALISFAIVAIVVFFGIVHPMNKLISFAQRNKKTDDPETRKCPECLSEVQRLATRCKFCAIKLTPQKPGA